LLTPFLPDRSVERQRGDRYRSRMLDVAIRLRRASPPDVPTIDGVIAARRGQGIDALTMLWTLRRMRRRLGPAERRG
jgi:hypothetical protein